MEPTRVRRVILATAMFALLAVEVALLVVFAHGTWDMRVGALLQILAVYALGLALVTKTKLADLVADDMTSPDPARFVAGNLRLFAFCFLILSVGFQNDAVTWSDGSRC